MKICVYAIAKNEEKFVHRWVESMGEADEIYVLDTGSTDNTLKLLQDCGVKTEQKIISPWRFDTARNESLNMVPMDCDVCVCTDLDEVFHKGWRKRIEEEWKPETTRARYRYTWNFNSDGSEGTVFWIDKIHSRKGYKWKNPVHEVLASQTEEHYIKLYGVQLDHHADDSKSRKQYLPLLELAVKEEPLNDRNMHYLGREYMFAGRYPEAIQTLKKHLELPSATWRDERCASMRYIARCLAKTGQVKEAYKYFLYAIAEAPYLREPWLDAAYFEYRRENWLGAAYFIEYALKIKERGDTYITDPDAWNSTPYDALSIAYYHLGDIEKAKENVRKAIAVSDDPRLKSNLKIFQSK